MIPSLYRKDGVTKIGDLTNCIECFVEEERNGIFEVSLVYPTTDAMFNNLEEENIIMCNANDTLLNQKFRIYMTRKLMSNRIEVLARHISFDLAHDTVNSIEITNQSCEYALNTIFRQSQFSTHYRGYSDIITAQDYKISMCNCIEAIAGKHGSIVDTYGTGAEILRDNTNIHVLNKRGHDNGVTIEYAKNLTGFQLEEDTTDLVTRVMPYAKSKSESGEEIIIMGDAVDSPLINNYAHPYISYIDYSDKFEGEEVPNNARLTALGKLEYEQNKVDISKQNYKIEFIPLSKCVGYEGLEDKISICDIVTIKDARYGIDTKAKVIRTVFDVLKNRYDSMELGEPRTTLGDVIGGSGSSEGQVGPPGPPGPPGADGNIGDFPDSLPQTPVLSYKLYGFSNIELSWTFDNKIYYQYELYASKTKNFTPNVFDIIHQGQSSSFLFQAKSNETWYFRVCCVNSHGNRTTFSDQISVTTTKIDDLSNYVDKMAIGDALIGTLSLERGWIGQLKGNHIDAKQLTVTDGNGKRTLDIDTLGNVSLDVASLKIASKSVATEQYTQQTAEKLETKFSENAGYNLFRNSLFENNDIEEWWYWGGAKTYWNKNYFTQTGDMWFGISSDNPGGLWQSHHELEPNTEYTLSLKIGWEFNVKEVKFVIEYTSDYNNDNQIHAQSFWFENDGSKRQSVTFTTPSDIRYAKMGFYHGGSKGGANGYLICINKPCLTKGIGKVWTPNPMEALDKATTAKQTAEGFNASITQKLKDDYYKKTDIDATVNGLQIKMQESGGYNLLRNGLPSMKGLGSWHVQEDLLNGPNLYRFVGVRNDEWTGNEPALEIYISNMHSGEYRLVQEIDTTPGQVYVLTGYLAGHRSNKAIYIRSSASDEWTVTTAQGFGPIHGAGSADDYSGWEKIYMPFTAQRNKTKIDIMIQNSAGSSDSYLWAKKLMVTAGTAIKPWSPNPNELYAGIVDIGRDGVVVTHSNGSYTQMSHNGLEHWENGMARPYHYMFDTVVFDAHGKCNGTPFRVQLPEKFRGKRFTLTWQMGNLNVPYDKVSAGHQVNVTNIDYNNATCDVTVKVFTKSTVSGGASADAEAYGWAKIFIVY